MREVSLEEASSILLQGGIVILPTETFYGISCDAKNPEAIEKIRIFKGRDLGKAFPVLIPSTQKLFPELEDITSLEKKLTNFFWPGPLTLLLRSRSFPKSLTNEFHEVGFRHSPHPVLKNFFENFDGFLVSTSANRSGDNPAKSPKDLDAMGSTDLPFVNSGDLEGKAPSTVLRIRSSGEFELVREGAIPSSEIQEVLRNG